MGIQMSKFRNFLIVILIIGVPAFVWWWGEDNYNKGYEDAKSSICNELKERSARLADDICN
tara:strand:+ start:549 stop:731 length:183 start_codon:yes stop_codon:yes gene_type:complete